MNRIKTILTAGVVLAALSLRADIIWSGEQNVNLYWDPAMPPSAPLPGGAVGLAYAYLDLNGDGVDDFQIGDLDPVGIHPLWFYAKCYGDNKHTGDWVGDLGGIIEGSRPDWTGGEHLLVSWMNLLNHPGHAGVGTWIGKTGYMGVQFEADDGTHFGWVQMTMYDENPAMTIYSWAYNSTPGEGVVAGAVPEPSSAILTVIGAMSVWVLRRQNRISKHWKES